MHWSSVMVNGSRKERGKEGWRDVYNHAEKDSSEAPRLLWWDQPMKHSCVCRDGPRREEHDWKGQIFCKRLLIHWEREMSWRKGAWKGWAYEHSPQTHSVPLFFSVHLWNLIFRHYKCLSWLWMDISESISMDSPSWKLLCVNSHACSVWAHAHAWWLSASSGCWEFI